MGEHEWDEPEEMDEACEELFGDADVEPSLYRCRACALELLAAEVRWNHDDVACCPRCGRPLDEI